MTNFASPRVAFFVDGFNLYHSIKSAEQHFKGLPLTTQSSGRKEILEFLGYIQPTGNYKSAIEKLLKGKLIERTLPDKPNSRLQKHRLTVKGKDILALDTD